MKASDHNACDDTGVRDAIEQVIASGSLGGTALTLVNGGMGMNMIAQNDDVHQSAPVHSRTARNLRQLIDPVSEAVRAADADACLRLLNERKHEIGAMRAVMLMKRLRVLCQNQKNNESSIPTKHHLNGAKKNAKRTATNLQQDDTDDMPLERPVKRSRIAASSQSRSRKYLDRKAKSLQLSSP